MNKLSGSISKEWIALILLPMMSSIAGGHSVLYPDFASDGSEECMTAINVSRKDRLTLSISVAVGSTIVSWFTATESSRELTNMQNVLSKLLSS
jgi:Ca2+:H+ antiporter